jgi:hypothetical protein
LSVFFEKKLKKRVLLNEKGFCKERFVLEIVPTMEKRVRTNHQRVQNVV